MYLFEVRPSLDNLVIYAAVVVLSVNAAPSSYSRAIDDGIDISSSTSTCSTSIWKSILLFYATNYLAHIATVRSVPGAKIGHTLDYMLLSLVMPYFGVGRGLEAILRHAIFNHSLVSKRADSELQIALKSGALCVVVRAPNWNPIPEDRSDFTVDNVRLIRKSGNDTAESPGNIELQEITNTSASSQAYIGIETPDLLRETLLWDPVIGLERNVQGVHHLPQGYTLAVLPTFAKVKSIHADLEEPIRISSNWNAAKVLITIIQTFYASFTLYETTQGQQTDQYGYAAFGFTVIPFLVMSIVNLFGSLVTPEYAVMFLVRSKELGEAQDRGGKFDGIIGTVVADDEEGLDERWLKGVPAVFSQRDCDGEVVEGKVHCNISNYPSGPVSQATIPNQEEHIGEEISPPPESEQIRINSSQSSIFVVKVVDTCYLRSHAVRNKLEPVFEERQPPNIIAVPSCTPFQVTPGGRWNGTVFGSLYLISACLLCGIPFAIIGSLTKFREGHSTVTQRSFTIGWLVMDFAMGYFSPFGRQFASGFYNSRDRYTPLKFGNKVWQWFYYIFIIIFVTTFAVGGFLVVGLMILDSNVCNN